MRNLSVEDICSAYKIRGRHFSLENHLVAINLPALSLIACLYVSLDSRYASRRLTFAMVRYGGGNIYADEVHTRLASSIGAATYRQKESGKEHSSYPKAVVFFSREMFDRKRKESWGRTL